MEPGRVIAVLALKVVENTVLVNATHSGGSSSSETQSVIIVIRLDVLAVTWHHC
jgi:hypothetical protein